MEKCEHCGNNFENEDMVYSIKGNANNTYERICFECHGCKVTKELSINLGEFKPFVIDFYDIMEDIHKFKIQRKIYKTGITLEANEIIDGKYKGYEIHVFGDFNTNIDFLYDKLVQKIKKYLTQQYIVESKYGYMISGDKVAGIIDYDKKSDGIVPLVKIDGKNYTWNELGKMLTNFEGWQFRLEILEKDEDI